MLYLLAPAAFDPVRASADESREVRKGPVLTTTGDLLRLRVDGYHPPAVEWANVGLAVFIEGKIPAGNRSAPIAQYPNECGAPFCPIRKVIRLRVVRSAFGPIHLDVWVRL